MRPARFAALLLTAFLVASGSRAVSDKETTPEERVDALVEEYGVHGDEPGVGVLVTTSKGVELKKGYGIANLAKGTPITTATTFELASVSKHVTGAAVLLLVQRGKVKVGDEVRKYLPEIPVYDPKHPITVDQLSRHTSGLPDYFAWQGEAASKKAYYTNADAIAEFARRKESSPLLSVPGEEYAYSNTGYMVLASLVERVSGLSFGAFLAKEFFEPLGMKTAWVHESPRVPTVATAIGYTREDDAWKATWSAPTPERHEDLLTAGDGSVWASLDDMAAWDRGLRAGKPLEAETLMGALVPGKTRDGERIAYAMGWELEYGEDDAVVTMSHNGSWEGFETYVGHDVAREVTVVVLSNRRGFDAEGFGEAVGALFRK
jgi:CubicO group peptidase (beta-lactamase class C family)